VASEYKRIVYVPVFNISFDTVRASIVGNPMLRG
jgi:hypothetical protein